VTAINVLGRQKNWGDLIDSSMFQLLKLTGLAHDIGHAAFSHVSEKALQQLVDMAPIAREFALATRGEKKSLSEIMAYYLVRSPAFRDFVKVLLEKCELSISFADDPQANAAAIIDKISAAIIGMKIDDRLPLLHQLISGPFDADKLDYSVRDTRFAGTPSITDISRLVQKLAIKKVAAGDLPEEVGANIDKTDDHYVLFGVKWSGISTLDELHLSRVLLFAKIYQHAKVVAIEEMLAACIATLAPIASSRQLIRLVYDLSDDSVLTLTENGLKERLGLPAAPNNESAARLSCALAILKDVQWRRLHTKAFQFQLRYPEDPLERDPTQKAGLIRFQEQIEHPQMGREVWLTLVSEVERILKLAPIGPPPSRIELESQITIRVLGQTPGATQIARAYLLPVSGKPIPFRDYQVNRGAWAESYLSDRPVALIFCPIELGDTVYLATERILRDQYEVHLPPSALEAGKRDGDRLETRKQILYAAGYYRDAPFDIRPFPPRLRKIDAYQTVVSFKDLLAAYHEPTSETNDTSPEMRSLKIEHWLRQFEEDDHVECALRLLTKIRMLTRSDTTSAVRSFIASNPEFRDAIVVPFGDARDSSAIHTYFSGDLQGSYISGLMTLDAAADAKTKVPIIFVDDLLASGGQMRDILARGFGVPSLAVKLGEQRQLLPPKVMHFLKTAKTAFVFTAAWDEGLDNLRAVTAKLEMKSTVFSHLTEGDLPFAFDCCFEGIDSDKVDRFRERCRQIGRELALQMSPRKSAGAIQRAEQRALGYGNRAMLLASPFNVPTQTLTVIWGTGVINGAKWQPLMARRKKN
jgi:HD superfamily phosphohydrolase